MYRPLGKKAAHAMNHAEVANRVVQILNTVLGQENHYSSAWLVHRLVESSRLTRSYVRSGPNYSPSEDQWALVGIILYSYLWKIIME